MYASTAKIAKEKENKAKKKKSLVPGPVNRLPQVNIVIIVIGPLLRK